jgi:uncharacterized protein
MQGQLNPEEIEATLATSAYGRIGCHADGRTYVVPVGYAYDGRRLICHSGEGLKIEMMRKNPHVCFEIEAVENLGDWRSVIAWGRYVELTGTEAALALGLLIDRLVPLLTSPEMPRYGVRSVTPPARAEHPSRSIIYAIELDEKTGRFERITER